MGVPPISHDHFYASAFILHQVQRTKKEKSTAHGRSLNLSGLKLNPCKSVLIVAIKSFFFSVPRVKRRTR